MLINRRVLLLAFRYLVIHTYAAILTTHDGSLYVYYYYYYLLLLLLGLLFNPRYQGIPRDLEKKQKLAEN